jgi:hypothetical protein
MKIARLARLAAVDPFRLSMAGSAHATCGNLSNGEGEGDEASALVTYATLDVMLHDTNRTGFSLPQGFDRNI